MRTASTGRTIGRRALPAGMLSRGIDASAKIASPAGGDASREDLETGFGRAPADHAVTSTRSMAFTPSPVKLPTAAT